MTAFVVHWTLLWANSNQFVEDHLSQITGQFSTKSSKFWFVTSAALIFVDVLYLFFICCKLKIKPLDVLSTLLYWVEVVESISGGSFVWRGVVCYLDMVNLQAGTTAFNNMCMHCWTLCETVGDKQAVIKRTEALSLKNGCWERWLCLCCEAGVWSEEKMQCKLKRNFFSDNWSAKDACLCSTCVLVGECEAGVKIIPAWLLLSCQSFSCFPPSW